MNVRARLVTALVLSSLVWARMPVCAADEKPAAAKEAKSGEKKAPADFRGPLPFFYNKVLSPDEKEKLYKITEKYAPQIKELQAKIRELEEARNKEVDAALTPEQHARIKELRDEAAKAKTTAKPVSKTDGDAKPAEKKSE